MSERGSFVTEYIYCPDCLEAAKKILLGKRRFLISQQLTDSFDSRGGFLPIIAGKTGEWYPYGEIHTFQEHYIPELKKLICCTLKIAVIPENGKAMIFRIKPSK